MSLTSSIKRQAFKSSISLSTSCPSYVRIARITLPPTNSRTFSSATSSAQAFLEPFSEEEKGITVLTLNRPEAKNAIGVQLLAELEECIERVHFDKSTRVLILRSIVPNTFCAGADLKERKSMSVNQVDRFLSSLRRTFTALEKLPFPTITALDGLAMGGGMELALCTDLRLSTIKTDKLGLPETRLGIIPGAGGTYRMTKLIGSARTKELVFSARMLNGQEAFDLGIVDKLAKAEQTAFDCSIELAKSMAQNGPLALRAAKAAIDKGQLLDTETALDWERACYERCLASKDRLEGLSAFAEKRKPNYTGE
ncbi:hypothetical protein L7F22_043577 [Adiantum nelumboides]|nr:hypothetical protein [Adiantum nelumboides]